jgi:hypothetical protein
LARPSRSRVPGSQGACICECPSNRAERGYEVGQGSCQGEVYEVVVRG